MCVRIIDFGIIENNKVRINHLHLTWYIPAPPAQIRTWDKGQLFIAEEYPISFSLEIGHFIIFEVYFINMDLLLAQG